MEEKEPPTGVDLKKIDPGSEIRQPPGSKEKKDKAPP
jgi:hypothetical protein